jgi:hypothetical protein
VFSGHSLFGRRHAAKWQQFVDPIHGMTCNDLGQGNHTLRERVDVFRSKIEAECWISYESSIGYLINLDEPGAGVVIDGTAEEVKDVAER